LFNLNKKHATGRESFNFTRCTTQQTSNSPLYKREVAGLFSDNLHHTLSRQQCLWGEPIPIDALQREHRTNISNTFDSVKKTEKNHLSRTSRLWWDVPTPSKGGQS